MKFDLHLVSRGHNLHYIGWQNGYVLVQFRGRPDRYVYGPNVDRAEFDKVLRVPFPDRQFILGIKNKYQCHKIA